MDYTDINGKPIDINNKVTLHIKKLKEEKKDKVKNQNIRLIDKGDVGLEFTLAIY